MAMNVFAKVALDSTSTICRARCDKGAFGGKEVMGRKPTLPRVCARPFDKVEQVSVCRESFVQGDDAILTNLAQKGKLMLLVSKGH